MRGLAHLLALGLLGLRTTCSEPLEAVRVDDQAGAQEPFSNLAGLPNVQITTTFPQSEAFGIKIVNGQQTTAVVSFTNNEQTKVTARFVGGAFWTLGTPKLPPAILKNLSTTVYDGIIPPGSSQAFNYKFTTDMHPQNLRLALGAVVVDSSEGVHQFTAFNETVTIVEAPTSILDPQILFLYIVLVVVFAGVSYFVYSTWITTIFPQQKKRGGTKSGERPKTPSKSGKQGQATGQDATATAEGATVSTTSKGYDESWIPAHHIQQSGAKKRNRTPTGAKTKARPS